MFTNDGIEIKVGQKLYVPCDGLEAGKVCEVTVKELLGKKFLYTEVTDRYEGCKCSYAHSTRESAEKWSKHHFNMSDKIE